MERKVKLHAWVRQFGLSLTLIISIYFSLLEFGRQYYLRFCPTRLQLIILKAKFKFLPIKSFNYYGSMVKYIFNFFLPNPIENPNPRFEFD